MIAIVIGTNRIGSKSRAMGEYYKNLLEGLGAESRFVDLSELPTDFVFSALYHNSGKNELFNGIRDQMNSATKYVFIVPEYNNSFPGVLKAFIDGMSYPNGFIHKKCALVGISDGVQGNAIGLSHLTDVFNYLGMNVLAQKVRIPFMKKNFVEGQIMDTFIESLIKEQAQLIINF
jgi:chromate reductase, NAD(P)H dehydrogenase (quinone)